MFSLFTLRTWLNGDVNLVLHCLCQKLSMVDLIILSESWKQIWLYFQISVLCRLWVLCSFWVLVRYYDVFENSPWHYEFRQLWISKPYNLWIMVVWFWDEPCTFMQKVLLWVIEFGICHLESIFSNQQFVLYSDSAKKFYNIYCKNCRSCFEIIFFFISPCPKFGKKYYDFSLLCALD